MDGSFDALKSAEPIPKPTQPSTPLPRGLILAALGAFMVLAVSAAVIFVVLPMLSAPAEQPDYEIFTNLPGEGAGSAAHVRISQAGMSLLSKYAGAMGGPDLGKVEGAELAVIGYPDGTMGIAAYMDTSYSIQDVVELVSSAGGTGGSGAAPNIEPAFIGGKPVMVAYDTKDTEKQNPACLWMDGSTLKLVVFTNPSGLAPPSAAANSCSFPPGIVCSSFKLNQDGTLDLRLGQAIGHPMRVTGIACIQSDGIVEDDEFLPLEVEIPSGEQRWISGGDSGNATISCIGAVGGSFNGKLWLKYTETDTGMERTVVGTLSAGGAQATQTPSSQHLKCTGTLATKHDTKRAKELLAKADGFKSALGSIGTSTGELRLGWEDKGAMHGFHASLSSDADASYIFISGGPASGADDALSAMVGAGDSCRPSSPLETAEVVKSGGKQACCKVTQGMAPIDGMSTMVLCQRRAGDSILLGMAAVNGSASAARANVERSILGAGISGEEFQWPEE